MAPLELPKNAPEVAALLRRCSLRRPNLDEQRSFPDARLVDYLHGPGELEDYPLTMAVAVGTRHVEFRLPWPNGQEGRVVFGVQVTERREG